MDKRVVVGIDGSTSSREALLWAAEYVRATGGVLHAVYAWQPPTAAMAMPPLLLDWSPLERQSKELPHQIVAEVLGDRPGIHVVPRAVRGGAAEVLVKESKDADLLVVGSLGLGGLKGMMLGSVGHHCAAHSHCPTVIVHHERHRQHEPKRERLPAAAGV